MFHTPLFVYTFTSNPMASYVQALQWHTQYNFIKIVQYFTKFKYKSYFHIALALQS